MIAFNPAWGGQDVIQDTPPYDGMALTFLPSIASDVLGAVPQLDSESSSCSFMEAQFRQVAENLQDIGLICSATA